MNYESTPQFDKDFQKLLGSFPTLEDDLETAKINAIELLHERKLNNNSCFPVPGYCGDDIKIHKIKQFACKSIKGKGVKSGIRIIYALHPKEMKVVFIEIYYKGNKADMDYNRAKAYLPS